MPDKPYYSADEILDFCLRFWQRTGKLPSFERCKGAGLTCDDRRFHEIRSPEWLASVGIPYRGHRGPLAGLDLQPAMITDEEILERCMDLHAKGIYPSLINSGLSLGNDRFRRIRDAWMLANGIAQSYRGGKHRKGRPAQPRPQPALKNHGRLGDPTKPALVAAGLGEAPTPRPEVSLVQNPRTADEVQAIEAAKLAVDIAASVRAYKAADWRRPLKRQGVEA